MSARQGMASPKTRRHSKIDALPADVARDVRAALDAGHTYAEIARHLQALGQDVSASSVARYGAHFLERQRTLEETADKAAQLVGKVGNTDLEEAASRLALDSLLRFLIDHPNIDSDDPPNMLKTLSALARVQTAAVTRERWKTDVAKRAANAATDAAQIARKGGLSESAVELIRARILGIASEGTP